MHYLQNKPSTSFLCLLEPELWSLKDGARAQKTCFFPIFSRSYLRNYTTYLTKNPHTLFSNHVLQPCQISKQSEGVRGKHLLNWHGMTHLWDSCTQPYSAHCVVHLCECWLWPCRMCDCSVVRRRRRSPPLCRQPTSRWRCDRDAATSPTSACSARLS